VQEREELRDGAETENERAISFLIPSHLYTRTSLPHHPHQVVDSGRVHFQIPDSSTNVIIECTICKQCQRSIEERSLPAKFDTKI
jgi:hypothetical protein